MAKGRPKKEGVVRHPNGEINEAATELMMYSKLCEIHNAKHGVNSKENIPLLAYPIGRLFYFKKIKGTQLHAATTLARLYSKVARYDGRDNLGAKSLDLSGVYGLGTRPDVDDQVILEAKAEYNNAVSALKHCDVIGKKAEALAFRIATHEWFDIYDREAQLDVAQALHVLQKHFN